MSNKIKQFKIVVTDDHENDPDDCLDTLGWKEEIKEALYEHDITLIEIIDLDEKEVPNETT